MKGKARKLLSRNLRALRSLRGMTQEDLAASAEVDRSYISEIENGRFSASSDLVERLAEVLKVEIYEMYHPETASRAKAPRSP